MKKIILVVFLFIAAHGFCQETKTLLPQGTLIKASLNKELKGGKANIGDEIDFQLAEPIIVNDKVLVHKGQKIKGFVTVARSSGIVGRKGKLEFTINFLYLENGNVLKLTSNQAKKLKGSGAVVAVGAVVLTPFALFIPGKGAKYEAGTVFNCYSDENIEL